MANRYAIATGNWSNPAIWDGGVALPTTGDVVRANGFTVTIDQNITVADLRTDVGAPAAAGGGFTTAGGRTITANIHSGTTTCLTLTAGTTVVVGNAESTNTSGAYAILMSTGANLTMTGNVSSTSNTGGAHAVGLGTNSVVVITGNVTGTNSGSTAAHGILVANNNGSLTVNGTVSPVNGTTGYGIYLTGAGNTITINGPLTGGTSSAGTAMFVSSGTGNTININGAVSISGGTGTALSLNAGATGNIITIVGNVTGGSSNGAYAITLGSNSSDLRITGDVQYGASGSYSPAINAQSFTGSIDIVGNIKGRTGTSGKTAIRGQDADTFRIRIGGTIEWNSLQVFHLANLVVNSALGLIIELRTDSNFPTGYGTTPKYLSSYPTGTPIPANVRQGTTYGTGLSETGTLKVPAPASVLVGVPTDNTVGTAEVSSGPSASQVAAAVWNVDPEDIDDGTIGKRLANSASVEVVGAQLEAALASAPGA